MKDNYSTSEMIVVLLNKVHHKNVSMRLALSLQRKKYLPQDKEFWSIIYTTILQIEKHYLTINRIEKFVLTNRNISGIRSYLDLVTYWKFWDEKSSERIRDDSKKFFFSSNKNKRLFLSYLERIKSISLQTVSSSLTNLAEIWSFKFSLPALMYNLLQPFYSPKELNLLGYWFNSPNPTYIWINNRNEQFEKIVDDIKLSTSLSPISSVHKTFIVGKGISIQKLNYYKEGNILIQNLGATIVSQLVPTVSGIVIDLCAAPGNKTIQLYDKYTPNDSSTIIAGDVEGSRYKTLVERVPSLLQAKGSFEPIPGVEGIQIIENSKVLQLRSWDGTNLPFNNSFADLVFIDAPCTGSGTMGTKLDVRQLFDKEFLSQHIELQKRLLQEAHRIVKDKGFIFYTTCSLLVEENEDQINDFLNKNKNYSVINLEHPLNYSNLILPGSIKLFPPQSKTEGFFAVLLQKK